jgi:hypothetical protein
MPELVTRSKLIYQWNELPEVAKRKALEKYWDWNVDNEWWEWVYEDISEGFDGFSGTPNEFDLDRSGKIGFSDLNADWDALASLYLEKNPAKDRATYKLHTSVARLIRSRDFCLNYRYGTPSISTDGSNWYIDSNDNYALAERFLEDALSDFTHKCLTKLQDEYEYQTSREAISQMLEDRSFNDDGTLAD